jgi:hypothetical protein
MFEKVNRHSIQRTLRNVKSGFQNGWNHVKNIAGHIDNTVHVAKHIYRALEPAIKELVPQHHQHIQHHAIKALNGYESLREKALDAGHHVSNVSHKLSGLL